MSIKKTRGPPVAGGSPGVSEATRVHPPWLRSRAFLAEEGEGGCYSSTCVLLALKPRQGGRLSGMAAAPGGAPLLLLLG